MTDRQQDPHSLSQSPTLVIGSPDPLLEDPLEAISLPDSAAAAAPSTHKQPVHTLQLPALSSSSTLSSSPSPWPVLPASAKSQRTVNPIRALVEPILAAAASHSEEENDPRGEFISLALGDPTAGPGGHLVPCPAAITAIHQVLSASSSAAGYVSACGTDAARQAIARYHSQGLGPDHQPVSPDQVIVANGCSGALELALTALLDPDSILLVPSPGFPLYQVVAESHGAQVAPYRMRPECQFAECDLPQLHDLMAQYGPRVRGMVVTNPSNPTGAVLSARHLQELIQFAQQYRLVMIADEVYGDLTLPGRVFIPLARVAAAQGRQVPVITVSGLAKQFLLPGWRVGWMVFHDNMYGSLRQVEAGAKRLAQVILGASHLAQCAVPALLQPQDETVPAWQQHLRDTLTEQATFLCTQLATIPGLEVIPPGGAMYAMICLHTLVLDASIQSDLAFTQELLREENVLVLPGTCFGVANYIRVVFCAPIPVLKEAVHRIRRFCLRHGINKMEPTHLPDRVHP